MNIITSKLYNITISKDNRNINNDFLILRDHFLNICFSNFINLFKSLNL